MAVIASRIGTQNDQYLIGFDYFGTLAGGQQMATSFVPGATALAGTVTINGAIDAGTPVGMTAALYTNSVTVPGTILETSTAFTGFSGGSFVTLSATFAGTTSLTSGTTYWLVILPNLSGTGSTSNFWGWGGDDGIPTSTNARNNAGVWFTTGATDTGLLFQLNSAAAPAVNSGFFIATSK